MDEWVIWLSLTVGSFLALEIPALRNRREGDTLSEHVWRWLKVRTARSDAGASFLILARVALGAFLIWLAGHLAMGWWS